MSMMSSRATYKPFVYEQAYKYWESQQQAHWLHTEISMAGDISDFKTNLTESEKHVIGHILKGFTQSEIFIGDYWSNKVGKWFKHPEIQMMAATFSSFESIHAVSYAYLNDSLGLDDYAAFMHDPSTKAKIDRLVAAKGKSKEDIAKSLAIFSGFNEGVNLFSSFAILMNFQRFNKMKGLGQIIAFSIRDESLHSEAGCWLFRTFIEENPDIWTDELKADIYEAARVTVQLEDEFIDKAFELGDMEGLSKDDLKNYIRFRANTKLQDLGLKTNWKAVKKESIENMMWFDILSNGVEMQDFFAGRVSSYSKGTIDWSKMYE
jgi:ribonucleoside-diphosphate reductase beta chain